MYEYDKLIPRPYSKATDRLHIANPWLSHSGLGLYENRARVHDPLLMRFLTPDPFFPDFPGISPWAHTAANPLNAVDPDGQKIIASGKEAQNAIRYMLKETDRHYVSFDDNGIMSISSTQEDLGKSVFNDLKFVADHPDEVYVDIAEEFRYLEDGIEEIQPFSLDDTGPSCSSISNVLDLGTGEIGYIGSTIYPNGRNKQSIDGKMHVVINSMLSKEGRAQALGHELLGHTYLFFLTGDYDKSTHKTVNNEETNLILKEQILRSINEIIQNQK